MGATKENYFNKKVQRVKMEEETKRGKNNQKKSLKNRSGGRNSKTRKQQKSSKAHVQLCCTIKLNFFSAVDECDYCKCASVVSYHLLFRDRKRIITSQRESKADMPFRHSHECRAPQNA